MFEAGLERVSKRAKQWARWHPRRLLTIRRTPPKRSRRDPFLCRAGFFNRHFTLTIRLALNHRRT